VGAAASAHPFQAECFARGDAGAVDRSSTTIRVLQRDWSSHQLVSTVAAFILKEWLGYTVEFVRLGQVESSPSNDDDAAVVDAFRRGEWDVDVESWLLLQREEIRNGLTESSEPILPIGYSGRSGLYLLRSTVDKHKFADWWKFYAQDGHARSLGFLSPDLEDLQSSLGTDFPICRKDQFAWCSDELEGFWVSPRCQQNMSSCIQVIMGQPFWDEGYFEQVARNLDLPFAFAYYGAEGLRRKRMQLDGEPQDVIFYSWTSDWGAVAAKSARVSFPDPLTVAVASEYERHPNGSNTVDYPEVVLMKVLSDTLFSRAPEAYWMLHRLSIDESQVLELLGTSATLTVEQIEASACSFLKSNIELVTQLAPNCVTAMENPDNIFDRSTGTCTRPTPTERGSCFGANRVDPERAQQVIRFGQRDWVSHDLMRMIATILIEEQLGFPVRAQDISDERTTDWAQLLERNAIDAEMENWQIDIYDPLVQFYVAGSGIVEPPKEVGWNGRIGLFVMPEVAEKFPFSDYYKFFEGNAASQAGFRRPNNTELSEILEGERSCSDGSQEFWCEGPYEEQYYPARCRSADSACVEAVMHNPSWSQGLWEQLVVNNNLSIALSYFGSHAVDFLHDLRKNMTPAVFYGWVPWEKAAEWGLKNDVGRISFPDYTRGCAIPVSTSPSGARICDTVATTVYKLRRRDLADRAPEAAYVIDHLQVSQEQMDMLLSMHQDGGGNLTTREAACYFVKTMTETVDKALPECIKNPLQNPKMGDYVWDADKLACIRLDCPRNATLIYDSITHFSRCRTCSTETSGTVPDDGQMSCKPCPAATTPDELGETCVDCPPGRYAQEAASASCQACPEKQYNPLPGQKRCARCPQGAVCYGGINGTGATSFYAAEGYQLMTESDPQQVIAAAFAAIMLNCSECWDRQDPLGTVGPYRCPIGAVCLENNACRAGDDGNPVMEGPFCGSCKQGYQRSTPDMPCSDCPPDWLTLMVICVVMTGGIGGLCLLSWSQDASLGNLRGVYSIVLKILCNFFVQLKALGQVTDLNGVIKELSDEGLSQAILTSPVAFSLGIGDVLENPSTAIFSLECLMMSSGTSPRDSQYIKVLGASLLIPVVLLLTLLLSAVCCWTWQLLRPKPLRWATKSLSSRIILSFSSLAVLEMYFLQPMVTSMLLSVFNCQSADGGGTLMEFPRWAFDMSVNCESDQHQSWQLVTAFGLLVWSFGIPFILFLIPKLILRRKHYTLQSPEMWSVFGFLYDGFEPDFWYYESWMMLRKTYILIAANVFWLSSETRTVLLLTLVIYFRYMHLRDLPFDNRAYQGVDRLQFDSLATFTWLLLARLFRTMLRMTDNAIPLRLSPIFYIPAACNFMILLSRAVYLVLREMIWPLQSPPTLLPAWLRARLDHRLTFSFIPSASLDVGEDEHDEFHGVEHGSLSGLAGRLADDWSMTPVHTLPNEEREMLKTILTETVEVLLRRHEIVHKEAPQVVYLPTFLLQMERVLVASMCYAVKSRIINEELTMNRDTWGKWMHGLWTDTKSYVKDVLCGRDSSRSILRSHSDRAWHDQTCEHLATAQHLVKRPISLEEVQIALYSLWPELVDPKKNRKDPETNHLRDIVHAHKGIIDMHGQVSHIFDSDIHVASISRRRTRSVRIDPLDADLALMARAISAEDEQEESPRIVEDDMLLPSDIRIENMVEILKASRRHPNFKLAL